MLPWTLLIPALLGWRGGDDSRQRSDAVRFSLCWALAVFVPLNLALLAFLPERGALNRHGALRLAVLLLPAALAAWIGASALPGSVENLFPLFQLIQQIVKHPENVVQKLDAFIQERYSSAAR